MDERPRDALALVAVVLFAVGALVSGLRTGWSEIDVDERVYVQTLREMRSGTSYYDAMRDALVRKEGAPPSSVRAIRPPTMFLFLRLFPEGAWRWLASTAILVSLLLLWRLGRPFGPYGGVVAVAAGGLWLVSAAPLLFLHAELWGLPWFLGALVLLRREAVWPAVALLVVAVAVRELYVVPLGFAFLLGPRRRAWVVGGLAVGVLVLVHAELAREVLVSGGHEVAMGNESHGLRFVLRLLSPGDREAAGVLGAVLLGAGFVGAARCWRDDVAARVVGPSAAVLLVAAFVATRTYWSLTFAPGLMAFVPSSLGSGRDSLHSEDRLPT